MVNMLRMAAAFKRLGVGRSHGYAGIQAGVLPRPVKLGARAAALPDFEVEAIVAARIAGCDDSELRALVKRLHEQRRAPPIKTATR